MVAEAEPDVIVHQLTALTGSFDMQALRPHFAETNRLRTEGTDHLLAAGRAVGVQALRRAELRRLALRPHRRRGEDRGRPARPDSGGGDARVARRDPPRRGGGDRRRLDRGHRAALRRLLRARAPRSAPRAGSRSRRSASGSSRWSATAAVCGRSSTSRTPRRRPSPRVERGRRGIYNIVDDDPAPVARVAPRRGARRSARRPPRHVPRWLGRIAGR